MPAKCENYSLYPKKENPAEGGGGKWRKSHADSEEGGGGFPGRGRKKLSLFAKNRDFLHSQGDLQGQVGEGTLGESAKNGLGLPFRKGRGHLQFGHRERDSRADPGRKETEEKRKVGVNPARPS